MRSYGHNAVATSIAERNWSKVHASKWQNDYY